MAIPATTFSTAATATIGLMGGAGKDTMIGGIGDDVFEVDNAGDVVVENAGEGIDWVASSISYSLVGNEIENLELTGGAFGGTGNGLDNKLFGNALSNTLDGGDGNDRLQGGGGIDTLTGDYCSVRDLYHRRLAVLQCRQPPSRIAFSAREF